MNLKRSKNQAISSPDYVGIDIGKKELVVRRITKSSTIEKLKCSTVNAGVNQLLDWLKADDIIALEAGNQAFRIAKRIQKEGKGTVYVLNPGDLAMIYQSLKKTDSEDALKLARLISRIPVDELPVVRIPSDEIDHARRVLSEQEYHAKQLTALKNRLHSIFTQAGFTEISKKHLRHVETRIRVIKLLPQTYQNEARRLHTQSILVEEQLKEMAEEHKAILQKNKEMTSIAMSIPGVGPISALSLYAYLGDGKNFSSRKQVAYYSGLVPRVDISGTQVNYGRITKRGARLLRRSIVQAAWALSRTKQGGELKKFYEQLYPRIGKHKAIVATARKIVEIYYILLKNGETYRDFPELELNKKLHRYGII